MNNFWDNFWPCFLLYRQELISLVKGKHLAEGYLPLQNVFHALKHLLALQPSFGLLQLFLVYFIHLFDSQGCTLQNGHFSRHVPY